MFGGVLMMFFGLLFVLMVIALPILLIVAVITGGWGFSGGHNGPTSFPPRVDRLEALPESTTRNCSHCGRGLQDSWTHCPQCGAAV
jgi:hypothetical protein